MLPMECKDVKILKMLHFSWVEILACKRVLREQ